MTEDQEPRQELRASEEAVAFLTSIEPAELQKCVFAESLLTASEGGGAPGTPGAPGTLSVTVQFASRVQQPCVMLQAQSRGVIDGCPRGTAVTVFLTAELEVLEEDYHEYVKLEDHSVDKRCHMEQRDGQMVISEVTSRGSEVTKQSVSYPISVLRGLVTEGSSLLLMRLIALRKEVPKHMVFVSLDQQFHIICNTFSNLGLKQLEVGGEVLEVFGVERVIHPMEGSPTTWQCYFLDDGHLASRTQVGSSVSARLLQQPSQTERRIAKAPLVWEDDMKMCSEFLERREELRADHASYLRQHPEIQALISDFLQFLLLKKPEDVYQFAREYFLPFASGHLPEQS